MSFLNQNKNNVEQEFSLWQRFTEGDREAFDKIIKDYYVALFQYGLKFTKEKELLKDALHDAFVSLWQNRHLVNIEKKPYFYLLTIFRNQLIKSLKLSFILDEEPLHNLIDESAETQFIHSEDTKKIQALIQKLPMRHQEALHLRFFEELDNEKIAELMFINKQSVANLLHSGLKMLRGMWLFIAAVLLALDF
jgi:RNA polymerase sigma-70 factor (ECF subfamily)